jgi:hypothetical protein
MAIITLVLLNGCSQLFSIRLDGNTDELYFVFLKKDGKHASKFKIIDIAVKKIRPDSDPYSREGEFVWWVEGSFTVSKIQYGAKIAGAKTKVEAKPLSDGKYMVMITAQTHLAPHAIAGTFFYVENGLINQNES